jgi:hypothetical protein
MAIQVSGTSVINNSRQLQNIASLDSTTIATINSNISSGAITHLGTLTIGSGNPTSITLSSLNLTGYKQVHILFKHFNLSGNEWVTLNALSSNQIDWSVGQLYTGGGSSSYGASWMTICDLGTGAAFSSPVSTQVLISPQAPLNIPFGVFTGAANTYKSGGNPNTNITTSTTSITVGCRPGYTLFSGVNSGFSRDIDFYGVA